MMNYNLKIIDKKELDIDIDTPCYIKGLDAVELSLYKGEDGSYREDLISFENGNIFHNNQEAIDTIKKGIMLRDVIIVSNKYEKTFYINPIRLMYKCDMFLKIDERISAKLCEDIKKVVIASRSNKTPFEVILQGLTGELRPDINGYILLKEKQIVNTNKMNLKIENAELYFNSYSISLVVHSNLNYNKGSLYIDYKIGDKTRLNEIKLETIRTICDVVYSSYNQVEPKDKAVAYDYWKYNFFKDCYEKQEQEKRNNDIEISDKVE